MMGGRHENHLGEKHSRQSEQQVQLTQAGTCLGSVRCEVRELAEGQCHAVVKSRNSESRLLASFAACFVAFVLHLILTKSLGSGGVL